MSTSSDTAAPYHTQQHAIALQLLHALAMSPQVVIAIASPTEGLWKVRGVFDGQNKTATVDLKAGQLRAYVGRNRHLAVTGNVSVDVLGRVTVTDVIAPIGSDCD